MHLSAIILALTCIWIPPPSLKSWILSEHIIVFQIFVTAMKVKAL